MSDKHDINVDRVICDICQKRFKAQKSMLAHKRAHTGAKRYSCKHCDYTTETRQNMVNHRIKKHGAKQRGSKKARTCDKCKKVYNTVASRKDHQKRIPDCTKLKNFICEICSKAFMTGNYLNAVHMVRYHSKDAEEHRLKCARCNKLLGSKGAMQKHQLIHFRTLRLQNAKKRLAKQKAQKKAKQAPFQSAPPKVVPFAMRTRSQASSPAKKPAKN